MRWLIMFSLILVGCSDGIAESCDERYEPSISRYRLNVTCKWNDDGSVTTYDRVSKVRIDRHGTEITLSNADKDVIEYSTAVKCFSSKTTIR
ncbi:hypothetical protein N9948_01685 [bacterium]|nr:hypothetical protein [bacterium]